MTFAFCKHAPDWLDPGLHATVAQLRVFGDAPLVRVDLVVDTIFAPAMSAFSRPNGSIEPTAVVAGMWAFRVAIRVTATIFSIISSVPAGWSPSGVLGRGMNGGRRSL